jgi:hypothetical protein
LLPPLSAPALGAYQQTPGLWVARLAHLPLPLANAFDRELCRVSTHPDVHPALVRSYVINSIGHRFGYVGIRKVVHEHFDWIAFGTPLPTHVLVVPNLLFFLAVNRDHRTASAQFGGRLIIDEATLRVAVWCCFIPSLRL